jgi:hypothetical protein
MTNNVYKLGPRVLLLSGALLMQGILTRGQALRDSASSHSTVGATHFLWYTGHWSKTQKNVFIIDKSGATGNGGGGAGGFGGGASAGTGGGGTGSGGNSGGGTITIGPDGSVQMSGGTVDAWNKKIDDAEQSADNYLQILNNQGDNLEPSTHKLYEMLKPDADSQKQQIAALKIDPKQDILSQGKPDKPVSNMDAATAYCKSAKADYDQVMAFYKDHVKNHDADLNVPMPPGFEYECATCDTTIAQVYASTINNFIRDFMHPEDSIIRKGFEILHQVALGESHLQVALTADEYSALFSPNMKDPSKSGPCSYIDMTALSNAVNQTIRHLYLRAQKLVRDNKNNFRAIEAVSRTYLTIARQWQLTNGDQGGFEDMFPLMQEIVGKAIDFYVQKFKNNDWREIGNLTHILALFRQQALFGGERNNDKATDEYLADLQRVINGFELSVEMEIKVGNGPSYEYAHVKGKCHIIPEFSRDKNQCYKWVVADENGPTESLGFYKKKNLQSIDFDLITNERVSPPPIPKMTYTGTKFYTALLRNLSMDFCNPGHDTIMLSGFIPNPPSAGTWVIPNMGKQNMGLNNMEQFFESIEDKKKMEGEAQKQSDEMQQKGEEIRAKIEALQQDANMQKSGQNGNQPNNMEKIQELREQMEALSTNSALGMMLYVDFLLPVQNNDQTLVKHVYDAKDINPEEAPAIMIGNYTIRIENKQNGPTKKPPK